MSGSKVFKLPYARTRTLNQVTASGQITGTIVHTGHAGSQVYVMSNGMKTGTSRVMTDEVTPGYEYLSGHGKILNKPYVSTVESYFPGLGTVAWQGTDPTALGCSLVAVGHLGQYFEDLAAFPWKMGPQILRESGVDRQQLINVASMQAYGNVRKPRTLSLVTAIELPKTLRLLTSTARTLAMLYLAVRRGRAKDVAERLLGKSFKKGSVPKSTKDGVLSRWLEWRYGWGPLMMDISGTLEALDAALSTALRHTARGYSSQSSTQEWVSPLRYSPGGVGTYDFRFVQNDMVTVRAYVLYQADVKYQKIHDFGFHAFASTAWEILPFSFVADWFIPIGKWIQAIEPKLGVVTLASGYTLTRETILQRMVNSYAAPPNDSHDYRESATLVGFTDTFVRRDKSRAVPLGIPMFPQISVKLNAKRVMDAIALLGVSSSRHLRT